MDNTIFITEKDFYGEGTRYLKENPKCLKFDFGSKADPANLIVKQVEMRYNVEARKVPEYKAFLEKIKNIAV